MLICLADDSIHMNCLRLVFLKKKKKKKKNSKLSSALVVIGTLKV